MNEKYFVFDSSKIDLSYSHLFGILFSFVRRVRSYDPDIWSQEREGEEQKLLHQGSCGQCLYKIESQPTIKYTMYSNKHPRNLKSVPLKQCPLLKMKIPLNAMAGMEIVFDDGILIPVSQANLSDQFTP